MPNNTIHVFDIQAPSPLKSRERVRGGGGIRGKIIKLTELIKTKQGPLIIKLWFTYFHPATHFPIALRQCVLYNLSVHFVTRGLKLCHQQRMDSFQFHKDENNMEYITLRHKTLVKNFQGGIWSDEAPAGKRLYDVPGIWSDVCPIKPSYKQDRHQCNKLV